MKRIIVLLAVVCAMAMGAFAQDIEKLAGNESFVVLSTKRIGTMEKELTETANKGYRVLYGAPTNQVDMALLLERNNPVDRPAFQYKILATSRISTMQKELNEAGALGYRLVPRTIIFKTGFMTAELAMVMEKDPQSAATYEYDLIESRKETGLHKQVDASMDNGFKATTMIMLGKHVVVMEKVNQKA